MKNHKNLYCWLFSLAIIFAASAASAQVSLPQMNDTVLPKPTDASTTKSISGYVAKNDSIQYLFNALSSEAKRPYILSKLAQKKTITGDFDISNPAKFLDKISNMVGLAWYDDGQTIYVYDNSELKNAVVMLRHATLPVLTEFLQRTGLVSYRYPLRGEQKSNAFYIAGPPAYVDIVVNAASYLDDLYKDVDLNKQQISIIKLHNTFVSDRKLKVRDQEMVIPGIGQVIVTMLANDKRELLTITKDSKSGAARKDAAAGENNLASQQGVNEASQIKVIPYPETNSLLVKGTQEQIDLIKNLVEQLDVPKRHIELSLWIIDITKNALDKLGVDWQGAINIGSGAQVTLNASNATAVAGSIATTDGTRFMAQISALSQKGIAEVVSRPIILTQDNVPSSFDHNSTFYTKLEAERVASLESVTYGTMINVVPRYSADGEEVEMVLDIEDGQQNDAVSQVNSIPVITRTKISTVARVPKDKSLLIGGYTLDQYTRSNSKVPLLGDLPWIGGLFRSTTENTTKMVRIFLIQPKLLDEGESWTAKQFKSSPTLAPQMPLSDTLKVLKSYSGVINE